MNMYDIQYDHGYVRWTMFAHVVCEHYSQLPDLVLHVNGCDPKKIETGCLANFKFFSSEFFDRAPKYCTCGSLQQSYLLMQAYLLSAAL